MTINKKGRDCSVCGEYKEWDEFPLEKYRKTGHRSACKPCWSDNRKEYYQCKKEEIRKQQAEYYLRVKEEYNNVKA